MIEKVKQFFLTMQDRELPGLLRVWIGTFLLYWFVLVPCAIWSMTSFIAGVVALIGYLTFPLLLAAHIYSFMLVLGKIYPHFSSKPPQ